MIYNESKENGCGCDAGCCGSNEKSTTNKRCINIDFLYLDLSVCTRCQGADTSLDDALEDVSVTVKQNSLLYGKQNSLLFLLNYRLTNISL